MIPTCVECEILAVEQCHGAEEGFRQRVVRLIFMAWVLTGNQDLMAQFLVHRDALLSQGGDSGMLEPLRFGYSFNLAEQTGRYDIR